MMSYATVILISCAMGCLLFAVGLIFGIRLNRQAVEKDGTSRFGEAIKLWRNVAEKIDEMARRNVVELGSVRERLAEISHSMIRLRVPDVHDELTDTRRSEQEVDELHSRSAIPLSSARENEQRESRHVNTTADPHDTGFCKHDENASAFDDFLSEVTNNVQQEMPLGDLLSFVYEGLRKFVPFQRMGYAEIDYDADEVTAVWLRSERPVQLEGGYSARLSESSLQFLAEQNRPRVLNDLLEYLHHHPSSDSTRLIVEEGFRSSLTFPIVAEETVVAFLFLSSVEVDGFGTEDVNLLRRVVAQIGIRKGSNENRFQEPNAQEPSARCTPMFR